MSFKLALIGVLGIAVASPAIAGEVGTVDTKQKVCLDASATTGTRITKQICKSLADWRTELGETEYAKVEREVLKRKPAATASRPSDNAPQNP